MDLNLATRLRLRLQTTLRSYAPASPATRNSHHETWLCVELPVIEYQKARDLQSYLVSARRDKTIDSNIILILEHPPVFTLGRRGGLENLSVPESFLEKSGIPVIHVERGGDITFHGPGQIVVYPIINFMKARMSVPDYVNSLEEIMIQTAINFGVPAKRNELNRGIWVGKKKLGSVGIAVRRGISFHGMALNVNLSLEPFNWINPCGMQNVKMTSIQQELSHPVSMPDVRHSLKKHFKSVFGIKLMATDIKELYPDLKFRALELK